MRFIGSKVNLLHEIDTTVKQEVGELIDGSFCDIFSGTATVGKHFKTSFKIISNDSLYLSYVLQRAFIVNNKNPQFHQLLKLGIKDPVAYLNTSVISKESFKSPAFIRDNYSPFASSNRMYLSINNAERIDFIRQTIELWLRSDKITEDEYFYLLALLIEAVPFVSNITGTYGAYLKHWDKRALNNIELINIDVYDNGKENKAFCEDANKLIRKVEGDILYIDPPYNSRQYEPNYHLLETIASYDDPIVYGITGMRPYSHKKSKYCLKNSAIKEFDDLIKNARFKHIIMSYSSDGIMTEPELEKVLKKYGIKDSYKLRKIPYRKYKSKIRTDTELFEYVFYVRKEI